MVSSCNSAVSFKQTAAQVTQVAPAPATATAPAAAVAAAPARDIAANIAK